MQLPLISWQVIAIPNKEFFYEECIKKKIMKLLYKDLGMLSLIYGTF